MVHYYRQLNQERQSFYPTLNALLNQSLGYYFTASFLKVIDVFNIEARQNFNGKQSVFGLKNTHV